MHCHRRLPLLLVLCCAALIQGSALRAQDAARDISLDGSWQIGIDRSYNATTVVPGLAQDPAKPSPGMLWYRRTVQLPAGDWQQASMTLKGARFHPEVYVNGTQVGSSEGGMAPTVFALHSPDVAPGRSITLEIALHSLTGLDTKDASAVPGADIWRTNDSSGLWDDVVLHVSGHAHIVGSTPWTDFARRTLAVHWTAEQTSPATRIRAEIVDKGGAVVAQSEDTAHEAKGIVTVALPAAIKSWSPDHPELYRLRLTLLDGAHVQDVTESTWGFKHFETHDKRFYLNGEPVEMLGATVVWQRFLRTPGAGDIAFDTAWFTENITGRLKSYGANTLRWHLGLPPERMLDLCDQQGLMVQLEWPFFHYIAGSIPSMEAQWTAWLNVAMRHPSVMIVHPWNEVGNAQNGTTAINAILPNFPPLVVAHRDTVHIHKYWWSLFENLGLYYDSVSQFDKTAMVDEFGGNYLDFHGDPGGYPAARESFLRFLGHDALKPEMRDERLEFHAESNARIAEYWRRIGAPGILPFCALGGPQDGSSWFLGDIHHPTPMPVWDELAAAYSPVSLSLEVWDRNYTPGQQVTLPLYLFNDSSASAQLRVDVRIVDTKTGAILSHTPLKSTLDAHMQGHVPVKLTLPPTLGSFRMEAVLLNPPANVLHPVVSSWDVRTLAPRVPPALASAHIAIAGDEPELRTLLQQNGLMPLPLSDPSVNLIVGSSATWKAVTTSGPGSAQMAQALHRGASIMLLDAGPRDLGEGYRKQSLGSLEGAPVVRVPYTQTAQLFDGVQIAFKQLAEPESHIQPAAGDASLWDGLPIPATWIWNGLRGGLIAPAVDMNVSGLSQTALLAQWKQHGADTDAMSSGKPYVAYEFAGYYAFAGARDDKATSDALRARVRLLAEDAPALKDSIDPNGPITQTDLAATYRGAAEAHALTLVPLSNCGKSLTRTEIVALTFGPGRGTLVVSQALTAGRLARGAAEPGLYGVRYDPAAEQFTLNMMARALTLSSN